MGSRSKSGWSGGSAALLLGSGLVAAIGQGMARRRRQDALLEARTDARRAHEARQRAEAANRWKSEFLTRVNHELRTPLTAILGFARMLESDELADPQRESVTQIVKGGQHLLGLVNDLLDVVGIDTGHLGLAIEPVLVGELIGDVLTLMRPIAADREVHLVVEDGAWSGSCVLADPLRFQQVLMNLLSNAVKYNPVGGTVRVSCARGLQGALRVAVADTGPGVDPADRPKLFVPFERLGARNQGVGGLGVGLALSKGLVEAMGGTMGLDPGDGTASDNGTASHNGTASNGRSGPEEGSGSTFWFELPLAVGHQSPRPTSWPRGSRSGSHPSSDTAAEQAYRSVMPST